MATDTEEPTRTPESPGVVKSIGELGADILALAELQTKLGWEDLKTASRHASRGVVLALVAAGCALGGTPIVLLGIAEILADVFGWRHSITLFVFGIVTLVISVCVAIAGAKMVFRNFAVFRRSRDELIKNLEWLKQVSRQTVAKWNGRG